ncbi:hypothetical protein [Vibrio apostichopi]|uniref:hypothetical protein n=1 Tax=Vibrio apostichopi TaxID=3035453 RepID=UPI002573326D|nr:hypothetical protein [Vibrio sp. FE10]
MSNKVAYKKSRKVILKLLNDSFPTPVDIDIFYIEGETPPADRKLKNYNDVTRSWDNGYSFDDNPIQNELYIYRETLRVLVDEGLVSHETEDKENRRLYVRCKLTPKGQNSSLASGSELLMLEPNFYGIGIRLRVLFKKLGALFGIKP